MGLAKAGVCEVHGFELAERLREDEGQRTRTAHGTLYKALTRMEKAGLLSSVREDPDRAAEEGRPRRRLYSITSEGRFALARAQAQAGELANLDRGLSPS